MDAGQEGQLTDLVRLIQQADPKASTRELGTYLFERGVRAPVQDADDELLHGIFTTAMEGGVNYWARVRAYHWQKADGTDDLQGFHAEVRDAEDGSAVWTVVDRAVIMAGMNRLRDGLVKVPDVTAPGVLEWIPWPKARQVWADEMEGRGDAETADVVVQAGLFGELRYG